MTEYRTETSPSLTALHELNRRLAELMPRLERANKEFADAARPLHTARELNEDQKTEIGGRLRAAERELQEVTNLIKQVHAAAQPERGGTTTTSTTQVS